MEKTTRETPFSVALKHSLDKKGWGGASALARTIDRSSGYISELANGKKDGDEDVRREIAWYFGYEYDPFLSLGQWILDGKNPEDWKPAITGEGHFTMPKVKVSGQATSSPPPETLKVAPASIAHSTREIHRIPIISWVRAGNWCEVEDPFHPGDAEEWVDTTATINPNAFALLKRTGR